MSPAPSPLTPLWALVRNDLRLFFSDRRAVIITVLVPVMIASFFGAVLGGGASRSGGKNAAIALLIADEDNSPVSQEIIAKLEKESDLAVRRATSREAREAVKRGKAPVALVLPAGFGKTSTQALFSGASEETKKSEPRLLYDPSHTAEYQMARGLVLQQVMQVVSKEAFSAESAGANADEQLKALQENTTLPAADKAALTELLSGVKHYYGRPRAEDDAPRTGGMAGGSIHLGEEEVSGGKDAQAKSVRNSTVTHAFIGMAVQGVLFFAIDAAMGMLRDRRIGLWKRLRAAPLSRGVLLGSRMASAALITLVILSIVFGVGAAVFGVRIGPGGVPGFALLCCCTAVMVAAFGLLIAALGRTEQQSRGYAVPTVLAMSLLGGAWLPSFLMPAWVQSAAVVIPTRWAIDGFDAVTWRGLGSSPALLPSLVLLGFAAVFSAFALARFRWEAE